MQLGMATRQFSKGDLLQSLEGHREQDQAEGCGSNHSFPCLGFRWAHLLRATAHTIPSLGFLCAPAAKSPLRQHPHLITRIQGCKQGSPLLLPPSLLVNAHLTHFTIPAKNHVELWLSLVTSADVGPAWCGVLFWVWGLAVKVMVCGLPVKS